MNTNLVFIWLRDERYNVEPEEVDVARFLPVEVIDPTAAPEPQLEAPSSELNIALAGRHRLTVRGSFDPGQLAALILLRRGTSSRQTAKASILRRI